MLLIADMCPCSPKINFSSSSILHFWRGDSRKSQDLAWAACSVRRKADLAATNSEFSRCKVLAQNAGCLLASMPPFCPSKPIECSHSESVSVSVPQDKFRGSAILDSSHEQILWQGVASFDRQSYVALVGQSFRGRAAVTAAVEARRKATAGRQAANAGGSPRLTQELGRQHDHHAGYAQSTMLLALLRL